MQKKDHAGVDETTEEGEIVGREPNSQSTSACSAFARVRRRIQYHALTRAGTDRRLS